jgi:capsular polysaccharide biosynthesis protein
MVFHVLNRGVARMQVFEKAGDYQAFEHVLTETLPEDWIARVNRADNEKELEALRRTRWQRREKRDRSDIDKMGGL